MNTHTSELTSSPAIDESQLPDWQRAIIADIRARQTRDPRIFMSRTDSCDEGGWRMTSELKKEEERLLHVVRDGGSVKITTASFYRT